MLSMFVMKPFMAAPPTLGAYLVGPRWSCPSACHFAARTTWQSDGTAPVPGATGAMRAPAGVACAAWLGVRCVSGAADRQAFDQREPGQLERHRRGALIEGREGRREPIARLRHLQGHSGARRDGEVPVRRQHPEVWLQPKVLRGVDQCDIPDVEGERTLVVEPVSYTHLTLPTNR